MQGQQQAEKQGPLQLQKEDSHFSFAILFEVHKVGIACDTLDGKATS